MKHKLIWLVLATSLMVHSAAQAQNFSLRQYTRDQIDDQIEPLLQLFAALVGSGFVNTAELHGIAGFDLGARAVLAIVPDEYKTVVPSQPQGPLAGQNVVPLPFLNASLGLPGNLEAMGRLFTFPLGDDPTRGTVTLAGLGLKYGILQLPALPKIVVIGAYHMLFVPEDFDFCTVKVASAKVFSSVDFFIFTLYVGTGIDRTFLTVEIPADSPNFPGGFKETFSGTHTHTTVGLTATIFPLVRANFDYNFGQFPSATVGLSVSFR